MESFLLSYNSAGRLSSVILSFLVMVFILTRKKRDVTLRWFAYYFIFSFIVQCGFFTAYSLYHPAGASGWIIAALAPFGLVCLIQFAYRFPSPLALKEAKAVFLITMAVSVYGFGDYLYHCYTGYIGWMEYSYGNDYASRILFFSVTGMYVWVVSVFVRQTCAVSRREGDGRSIYQLLIHPSSRQARAAQRFSLVVLLELALPVFILIWFFTRSVSPDTLNVIENAGFLMVYLLYIFVFINYSSYPTSLLMKLVSTSLVMVFLVVAAAGHLASKRMEWAVVDHFKIIAERSLENFSDRKSFPQRDIEFILEKIPYVKKVRFSVLYAKNEKFDILKFYENNQAQHSVRSSHISVSGTDFSDLKDSGYSLLRGRDIVFFYYTVSYQGKEFFVGFDYRLYREYIHRLVTLFIYLYLVAVLVIGFLYPLLFRFNILGPIQELIKGIRVVKDGNLELKLPLRYDDEIGYLTDAFNEMVASLKTSRKYQEHYSYHLENAFLKIDSSKKEIEENLEELRRTHNALQESEQRYKDLNAQLELRVADRTCRLEEANAELLDALEQLKLTQAELIRNEKLASLGDMVAGIAHEINTPVGVAITASSYLGSSVRTLQNLYRDNHLTKTALEQQLAACEESAGIIFSNLNRAGELIQSFKLVAADQVSEDKRSFNLCAYADDVLNSLRPRLKKTAHRVVLNCSREISVYSYPGAFSQIITNLVMNSLIHAFNEKQQGIMSIDITSDDDFLEILYCDDGCGIENEHISKIFAPFFTTRRQSGGTGLGLHIVYNLVTQKLGGSINAVSEKGKGVYFTMRIPMHQMIIPDVIA